MASPESTATDLPVGPEVQQLLNLHGIQSSFINYAGEELAISHADRLTVLELMGVSVTPEGEVGDLLASFYARNQGDWLPAASIVVSEQASSVQLRFSTAELTLPFNWQITTETADRLNGSFTPDQLPAAANSNAQGPVEDRRLLELPPLPAGYHRLRLGHRQQQREYLIIAAPDQGYFPEWAERDRKLAGISVHLYALRSSRNWGIGDFTDLETLVRRAADAALDFVVLNPLHVLDGLAPESCSPYSPLDRRFLNPLYIDVEKEPDFRDSDEISDYVNGTAFQDRLQELRTVELVDYRAVNHIKHVVLLKMFRHFKQHHLDSGSDRGHAFRDWLSDKGEALRRFGQFQAQRSAAAMHMSRDADYHYYLQWLAEGQLENCQLAAKARDMAVGLIRDLAVGSSRDSAEVHLNPDLFCTAASIGAPPDPLAPQGQNWGLPPMNPVVLKNSGFAHYIELLKDNMAHCGALRIDHIMSLMRLWWCPGQDGTGAGAYVAYPAEDLFAIMRLESQRQQCVIIGEDLGIVPPEIRQLMHDSAVFSNLLFYFEKYDPVHFRHPRDWNRRALAMVANHDVPTLAAWWSKYDLQLRDEIGLFNSPDELEGAIGARESDLIQILHWLNELHLLPDNWQDFNIHHTFDTRLCEAILMAVSSSATQLVSLQPEDLCLLHKPINIPGTHDQYPNWQRKLPVTVDELFDDAERNGMLESFVKARGSQ